MDKQGRARTDTDKPRMIQVAAREYETGDRHADALIEKLVGRIGSEETRKHVREIITTAVKLGGESTDRGDLKLANMALKELRYSFKTFAPYRHVKKAIVFGSARSRPSSPEYKMAVDFARKMNRKGYMIVTGGGPGVMEAGNKGAKGNDFALNIRLPFEQKANPFVSTKDRLINYKYFFTRKLFFVKESDATAVFPGGFGTLDEMFEMLTLVQTGKTNPRPIVLMEPKGSSYWRDCRDFLKKRLLGGSYISQRDTGLFSIAHSAQEAVDSIEGFYRVYHSLRFDGGLAILRLRRAVSEKTLARANRKFSDIVAEGEIRPSLPTENEMRNNEFLSLPRLSFHFDMRSFDRMHELIDFINKDGYGEPARAPGARKKAGPVEPW
jgi:uncharacterized protein (TIGR00730 family)